MKVEALKPILYSGKNFTRIFDKGEIFEMDDVSYYVREKRGEVKAVGKIKDDEEIVSEGLPSLDEMPQPKGKKK